MRPLPAPTELRAILWDLDGTLADSEPTHERSFMDAAQALGLTLPEDFHHQLLGQSEEATHAILVREHGLSLDLAAWSARRHAAYLQRIGEVKAHPDAWVVLRLAARLGLAQAVVSNSPRAIVRANLAQIGLRLPERMIISRDDVHSGKPDPEPYALALSRLDLAASVSVAVEDSASGGRAAAGAELPVCWMPQVTSDWPGWRLQHLRAGLEQALRIKACV